jgi:hypothetical protein
MIILRAHGMAQGQTYCCLGRQRSPLTCQAASSALEVGRTKRGNLSAISVHLHPLSPKRNGWVSERMMRNIIISCFMLNHSLALSGWLKGKKENPHFCCGKEHEYTIQNQGDQIFINHHRLEYILEEKKLWSGLNCTMERKEGIWNSW